MTKLSKAQQRLIDEIRRTGESEPPAAGNRAGAARVSAWHRTAESLERRGIIQIQRAGWGYVAKPDVNFPRTDR